MPNLEYGRNIFRIKNVFIVNLLSELFGSFLLLFLGIGIVLHTDLDINTKAIQLNVGWGLAVTFAVYCTAKTSGGHLNPAISFMMYTFGRLPLTHFLGYFVVQFIGSFIGTALAYSLYYDQIWHFLGPDRIASGPNGTAAMFTSMPAPYISNTTAFLDNFLSTGLLGMLAAVVIEKRSKLAPELHALLFGLIVILIGTVTGMNNGCSLNPTRDLAARVFAWLIGYGTNVFTYHNYYFWIPVIAPCLGTAFAAWIYYLFVGFHIPGDDIPKNIIKST